MATTPVVPTPTPAPAPTTPTSPTSVSIDKELQDSLAALAHKHVTVSYTLVGVVVLMMLLCCGGGYLALKVYEKEVARAEADEKTMQQDKSDYMALNQKLQTTLAQDAADRAAWAQQEARLVQQVNARNQVVNTQIVDVTKPGKSAEDAYADLHSAYKDNPTVESAPLSVSKDPSGEQEMTFPVPAVQQFTATKLDRDRLFDNLDSTSQELTLEKQSNVTLTTDLNNTKAAKDALQVTETQCETTVAAYKKVAVKSKFQKFLGGALKVVIFIGGVALGHYI